MSEREAKLRARAQSTNLRTFFSGPGTCSGCGQKSGARWAFTNGGALGMTARRLCYSCACTYVSEAQDRQAETTQAR